MAGESNLDKYKKDLARLNEEGGMLLNAIQFECHPAQFEENGIKNLGEKEYRALEKKLSRFSDKYQEWYSESLIVVKQVLPDRLGDFVRLFEKPRIRKSIDYNNYVVEDYLQGLTVKSGMETVVGPDAAIPKFHQQYNILKSAGKRFESVLFDIKQILQADLFDSELDAARELNKKGFMRAAGAVAGVVLEGHLLQVSQNHVLVISTKKPTIGDFNDLLKSNGVIDVSIWRKIQFLADLRNKCDHKKSDEPTKEETEELISGVDKLIKTLF